MVLHNGLLLEEVDILEVCDSAAKWIASGGG